MPTKTNARTHVGFRLDKPVYDALKALADRDHQTLSGLLRKLLAAFVATNA